MRNFLQIVAFLCCFSGFSAECFATSLDELYRDVIRSDNNDYLPLFVKNRKAPMVVLEEDDLLEVKPKDKEIVEYKSEVLKLTSTVDEKAQLMKERQLQWLRTIDAVKTNQVTAIELDDITSRVKDDDPKATEILAWMYTNGIGVSKDFVEAFNLYKKAAQLKVFNAEKNALIVYKSMSEEQRRRIKNSL